MWQLACINVAMYGGSQPPMACVSAISNDINKIISGSQ